MTPLHALRLAALAGLAPLVATPLLAQSDSYFYGGGSAGRSRFSLDDDRMAATLASPGAMVDDLTRDRSHTGYRLFGGYQFNRHIGVGMGASSSGASASMPSRDLPAWGCSTRSHLRC